VIDTYWSDHCRHTTFLTQLHNVRLEHPKAKKAFENYLNLKDELGRGGRPVTLMDVATIGSKALKKRGLLKDLDESQEINACSVKIGVDVNGESQPWLLMFKNETHNHPTEIEPFGGAATCLGGAIRDPLSGEATSIRRCALPGAPTL
jgi:phosphoribosylformylglycinamidine synthase